LLLYRFTFRTPDHNTIVGQREWEIPEPVAELISSQAIPSESREEVSLRTLMPGKKYASYMSNVHLTYWLAVDDIPLKTNFCTRLPSFSPV
jgi:hypothetical protein